MTDPPACIDVYNGVCVIVIIWERLSMGGSEGAGGIGLGRIWWKKSGGARRRKWKGEGDVLIF